MLSISVISGSAPGSNASPSSKGKSKAASNEWWYMESLRHAIPGYWTSNDPDRDSTRFDNNPEYAYDYSE